MKPIKLERDEKILAVVPERCHGPGWSNQPIWVYIGDYITNKFRTVCIQPNKMTKELAIMFDVGEVICKSLVRAVKVEKTQK